MSMGCSPHLPARFKGQSPGKPFPIRYLPSDISRWIPGLLVRISRHCGRCFAVRRLTSDYRVKMYAELPIAVTLAVYGLIPILVLAAGFFGWRKIWPQRRRYGADPYEDRVSERRKFWGYE
jgi:hypothetical protein